MTFAQDLVAALGEFVGTTLFLLLALGGAKTATYSRSAAQTEGLETTLGNQTILFIACSFGLSLLITAWMFYRITGGLFNPAITFALWLVGAVPAFRAILLVLAQLLGGIAGAALVAALTPFGGADSTRTTLEPGINIGQGLMIEAFLTAILVFSVLMLAAEKHRSTYLAPIGIGLTIFACHLFGVLWTGCGINPARAFGPSVVSASFPSYHWIYHVGPLIGALIAVSFYTALKAFDYTTIVFGQDADHAESTTQNPLSRITNERELERFDERRRWAAVAQRN
ncbi:aquaporin-like protein [Ceraceosorus guamensis]|uniref:Aquaporin-like protein n=1 Tax=Ceraceosorus guamensis TaxID=1522189 RepID=A0A316VWC6_9BASI|nr:aquaporin-like protein [Ceraceosorus guamensis]PWN40743.1 aquaporin-like protein [Ceraceosorus guamensis]